MTKKIKVDNNEYEEIYIEGRDEPIWKCLKCKATIKREKTLRTHLNSRSHNEYEANNYFWIQRTTKLEDRPFVSLLNPSVREEKRKVIEWATSKFYNERYINMSMNERLEYAHENDTTTFEIERHHYNMRMGI